jgi:hypothetical protein
MADRSERYSERERDAAIKALDDRMTELQTRDDGIALAVDIVLTSIGMKRGNPPFQVMTTAPHDRDIILKTPKGQEIRAVWWDSWHDPADPHPWAWRISRGDGTVAEPITEAVGWREV